MCIRDSPKSDPHAASSSRAWALTKRLLLQVAIIVLQYKYFHIAPNKENNHRADEDYKEALSEAAQDPIAEKNAISVHG